jgi:hypothetical protein
MKCTRVRYFTDKHRFDTITISLKDDEKSFDLQISKENLKSFREEDIGENIFGVYIAYKESSIMKTITFQCHPNDYFLIEEFFRGEYYCDEF